MVSNQKYSPLIAEALEDLGAHGIHDLCPSLQKIFNELMLIERERVLQASPYERTDQRKGYANGFKNKMLHTRSGRLELSVPQTRDIPFYPSCLEKGQRSERALALAIAEMYVNGVSTRRVKKITEELCGLEVSSTQVSRISKLMDEELERFRNRPLGKILYLYLDASYEKVRVNGVVQSLAVFTAIGINEEGHKEILGISSGLSEAEVHWRRFLESLLKRGLHGMELTISDDHSGLRAARRAVIPGIPWQRCIFHLCQNAQSYATTKKMRSEIARSMRDIYNAPTHEDARSRMQAIAQRYSGKAPRFSQWLEENCEEALTFYQQPPERWKRIRTNNVSERLNREVKRRTRIAGVFPSEASCERLITSIAVELHEEWISGRRYLTP